MKAVVIVLNDLNYLDEVLEAFVRLGVEGATILDSYGMGKALRNSKSLNYLMKGSIERSIPKETESSKTIFSIVPDNEKADFLIKTIESILYRSESKLVGFLFSLPVSSINPIIKK
ncbi:MAG: hypothetical protein M0O92_05315 [Acholeplasmataceae bacterium]|nr:hypothetical protein [Acholeplasmataceae bacterium]